MANSIKKMQPGGLIRKGIKMIGKKLSENATKPMKSLAQKVAENKKYSMPGLTKTQAKAIEKDVKSSSVYDGPPKLTLAEKKLMQRKAARRAEIEDSYKKNGGPVKKMQNGGSLSGLKASTKRVGPVDPKGAWTKVQERTIAGARGKAVLKKDKELDASRIERKQAGGGKMKMGGSVKKK